MLVQTTRFGEVEVDDQRVLTFAKGLLGFPRYKQFVLMEQGDDSYFFWLQSIEAPDLAFVVTDPSMFVPTYKVPIKTDQMRELGIESIDDAQVLVIVNKRDTLLTGNLQGPLVISVTDKLGEQLVLSDRRYTTRVPLIEVHSGVEAMSA